MRLTMANKRKKYPKMPSGYGSITFLGKGRRNPYMVRPPVTEFDIDGKAIRPKPICYTDTWLHGFAALTAWKAGTYTPGMESEFKSSPEASSDLAERIVADYMRISKRTDGITFKAVFDEAYEWKMSHSDITEKSKQAYLSGFKKCHSLHNVPIREIKQRDLQRIIDGNKQSSSSDQAIKSAMKLAFKYAVANDIVQNDYTNGLIIKSTEIKHGQAFSDEELRYIEGHLHKDVYKRIWIMCLSGFRFSAYNDLEIDLDNKSFTGGVKNQFSKNRTVPIHSAIYPHVVDLLERNGSLGFKKDRSAIANALRSVNPNATPHWTRHTFSALCERYGVRENDRKRMLGHRVGDITNDVYGHRTLEDLRKEIEKIDVQNIVHPELY